LVMPSQTAFLWPSFEKCKLNISKEWLLPFQPIPHSAITLSFHLMWI
jgi:hypothetical protein